MNEKELYLLLQKSECKFDVDNLGCGMLVYKEVIDNYWRTRYLLNTQTKTAYEIVGKDLKLKSFHVEDIDTKSIHEFEYLCNALNFSAYYPFFINNFESGLAYVTWTLHPDGIYFMDDDGFGMESCNEEIIGGYIDTNCKMVIKFQDLRDKQLRLIMYNEAIKLI